MSLDISWIKSLPKLTFRWAIDDCMLLLRVLEDALGAEHVSVLHAVKFYFFLRMLHAHLNLTFRHLARWGCWVGRSRHGQTRQNLVVHRKVVWCNLMSTLVIRALDNAVLGKFVDTLWAKGVTTGEWHWLFFIVVVSLEADAAFKDRIHYFVCLILSALIISKLKYFINSKTIDSFT